MPEKVQGIVLDSFKFKESSLICRIYTRQHGLLSVLVNGVRTKKAKVSRAYLQPLTFVDFLLYFKENTSLYKASEFSLGQNPFGESLNMSKCAISLFVAETVLRTFKEKEVDEKLFQLLDYTSSTLAIRATGLQDLHLYFLFQYSEILGFSLKSFRNFNQRNEFDSTAYSLLDVLDRFAESDYQSMGFSKEERAKLLKWMLKYYEEHLGSFSIKSIHILEDLFSI
jgi:DNA repair protein RecO (recombination protein O)